MKTEVGALADAIAEHGTLTSIDVSALRLDDGALTSIAAALQRNSALLALAWATPKKTAAQTAAESSIKTLLDRNRAVAARQDGTGAAAALPAAPTRSNSGSASLVMPSNSHTSSERRSASRTARCRACDHAAAAAAAAAAGPRLRRHHRRF